MGVLRPQDPARVRIDEDRRRCRYVGVDPAFEERRTLEEPERSLRLSGDCPRNGLALRLRCGCGMVGRVCGATDEPGACAGGEEYEQDEHDPSEEVPASSPSPALHGDEHVQRHRPRVTRSSVGFQQRHS